MDQTHWLRRSRSAQTMARRATSSEARMIHYQLVGLYSMKAVEAGAPLEAVAPILLMGVEHLTQAPVLALGDRTPQCSVRGI